MKPSRARPGRRVQLHRAVSKLGWGSRTQAWAWIAGGEICVDGKVVVDPLTWIDLDLQKVTRIGQVVAVAAKTAIALHKPPGVVTTRSDDRGRTTVYDLLPTTLPWMHPAGRLDADSEGLLILTNDSELSVRLTAPEKHVPKTYHVTLAGAVTVEVLARFREGIDLPDGRTRAAKVRALRQDTSGAEIEIVLTEGRNRQIRRMAAAVGCQVKRLVRVAIGRLKLGDLAIGQYRTLNERDREKLVAD